MRQSSTSAIFKNLQCGFACYFILLLILIQSQQSTTLVVPNELPSILSLVYSNIPPIKKGTDSRLGFGFRVGEHADFQVLIELGPQKETRPIGDQDDSDGNSFNKRQVSKRQQLRIQQENAGTVRPAATWLEKWSNDVNSPKKKVKTTKKSIANKATVEIPAMPQLPDQTLRQLQMLYKMATTSTPESIISSTGTATESGEIDAATHLKERLKTFKAPAAAEELQVLPQKSLEKTKSEITKELMDVELD